MRDLFVSQQRDERAGRTWRDDSVHASIPALGSSCPSRKNRNLRYTAAGEDAGKQLNAGADRIPVTLHPSHTPPPRAEHPWVAYLTTLSVLIDTPMLESSTPYSGFPTVLAWFPHRGTACLKARQGKAGRQRGRTSSGPPTTTLCRLLPAETSLLFVMVGEACQPQDATVKKKRGRRRTNIKESST